MISELDTTSDTPLVSTPSSSSSPSSTPSSTDTKNVTKQTNQETYEEVFKSLTEKNQTQTWSQLTWNIWKCKWVRYTTYTLGLGLVGGTGIYYGNLFYSRSKNVTLKS